MEKEDLAHASSHEEVVKIGPQIGFNSGHINEEFFRSIVKDKGRVTSWEEFQLDTSNSILSALTAKGLEQKLGHFGFRINYENEEGPGCLKVVVKSKPIDIEICNMLMRMAQGCGLSLANIYEQFKMDTGPGKCHTREVEIASLTEPVLRRYSPAIYHTIHDPAKEIYVIVMEYLDSTHIDLLDTADDISQWKLPDIQVILRDLAQIHSEFFPKQEWLMSQDFLKVESRMWMITRQPFWMALLEHAEVKVPQIWTKDKCDMLRQAIRLIPDLWAILEQAPKTLVHNDCNPRNIGLRRNPQTDSTNSADMAKSSSHTTSAMDENSLAIPYSDPRSLCMYDWELVYTGAPQHDVAELLAFILPPSTPPSVRYKLIEFYRLHLEYYSGMKFPEKQFHEIYNITCLDFAMNRLLMYTLVHANKESQYLPRVVQSHFSYLTHEVATGRLMPQERED